ncbi:MAG: 3-hydroxyacyl-ACP dehydratase FabZ [Acetobacteraceae bacterium]
MDITVAERGDAAAGTAAPRGHAIDAARLQALLPHRYPMLMIDRVEDVVRDQYAVGIKNVTVNEPYFQGHFPGHPVVPGVMIIESMAQTSAALVLETLGELCDGKIVYFMFIDKARFRRPVTPGDQMRIRVVKERSRGAVWKFHGTAFVDGMVAAEATYAAMIVRPGELAA